MTIRGRGLRTSKKQQCDPGGFSVNLNQTVDASRPRGLSSLPGCVSLQNESSGKGGGNLQEKHTLSYRPFLKEGYSP